MLVKLPANKNMINKPLRLAVFDCDGTLVDSAHSIISSMQIACSNLQLGVPGSALIRRTVGLSVEEAIAILFPSMGKDRVRALGKEFREVFTKLRDKNEIQEPLYVGVDETLNDLNDAGWLLGVATGKSLRGLLSTLRTHNLHHQFDILQTADLSKSKPDPEMLHRAIRDTGVEKERTVMIGDTSYDMEMACNAGIRAIGVTWGYHSVEELLDSGASSIVHTFSQLPQVLEELL